jgi:predicted CoA-binding protein
MAASVCEIPDPNPSTEDITEILRNCKTIAVLGCSPKTTRDSNRVARYLIEQGFEVIPVNPGQREILGRTCYKRLTDIPGHVDLANFFLNPTRVPEAVDEAIEKGVRAIWMQLGVVHNASARKARDRRIQVVMNKCIMVEHQKMRHI